jgi:hypothetical protein
VQQSIRDVVVPSWFTKLRPQFGEKSNGKLKADEWRSLFTVYLPITMMCIWVDRPDRRLHLKALLYLSIIVHITTSVTCSEVGRTLYAEAIELYLSFIKALNPGRPLVINHHLALHLQSFMELHGACHGHWAFPFERMIGKLQKTLHNANIGTSTSQTKLVLYLCFRGHTRNNVKELQLSHNFQDTCSSRA